jgi:hypothetical protein
MKWYLALAAFIGFMLALAVTSDGQMVTFPPVVSPPLHTSN